MFVVLSVSEIIFMTNLKCKISLDNLS